MNKQILNTFILSLITLSCGQLAAHDRRIDIDKEPVPPLGCIAEVPGNENRTPELPADVLNFLYNQLGLTTEATEEQPTKALVGMQTLPPELLGIILALNSERLCELSAKVTPQLLKVPLKVNGLPINCRRILSYFKEKGLRAYDKKKNWYLFTPKGQHIPLMTEGDERITFITDHPQCIIATDEKNCRHLFKHDGTFIRTLKVDGQPLKIEDCSCSIDERIWVEGEDRHLYLFSNEGIYLRTLKIGNEPLRAPSKQGSRSFPEVDRLLIGPHLFTYEGNYLATLNREGHTVYGGDILLDPQRKNIVVFTFDNKFCLFDLSGNLMQTVETGIGGDVHIQHKRFNPSLNLFSCLLSSNDIYLLFNLQGQRLGVTIDDKPLDFLVFYIHPELEIITYKTHDELWHVCTFDFQVVPLIVDDNHIPCKEIKCYQEANLLVVQDDNEHYHLFKPDGSYVNTLRANNLSIQCFDHHICPELNRLVAHDKDWTPKIFTLEGEYVGTFQINNQTCTARGITFAPQSQRIILDIDTFTRKYRKPDTIAPLGAHLFTPNGIFIATLNDREELSAGHGMNELPSHNLLGIQNNKKNHYEFFTTNGEPVPLEECLEKGIRTYKEIYSHLNMLSATDALGNLHLFTTAIHQFKSYLTSDQLLMIHLLAGLKKNWEDDYLEVPFTTCPADVTCALVKPLLELEDFSEEIAAHTKKRIQRVHTWVLYTLNSFKQIQLHDATCSYILRKTYNIEGDPVVRHEGYEGNGLIAEGYLVPYVRLRKMLSSQKKQ